MKLNKLLYIVLVIFSANTLQAQETELNPVSPVEEAVKKQLADYEKYGDLTKDGVTISKEYTQAFAKLFRSPREAEVYNFLDAKQTSVAIDSYVQTISQNFPKGIELDLDIENAQFSKPYSASGLDFVTVTCVQSVIGLDKNNTLQRFSEEVQITLSYKKTEGANAAKIESVHHKKTYKNKMQNQKLSGLYVGVHLGYQNAALINEAIDSDNDWTSTAQNTIAAGVELRYMFNRMVGISSGLSFAQYKTQLAAEYSIAGEELERVDKDNDTYYLHLDSELDEINTMNSFEIPVFLVLSFGTSEKFRFSIEPGIKLGANIGSAYEVKGQVVRTGYYPQYNITLYDLESYDLTTENYDQNEKWDLGFFNLSACIRANVAVKLSDKLYGNIGYEYSKGLSDLKYSSPKYRDDFLGSKAEESPIKTLAHGVRIAILYKL